MDPIESNSGTAGATPGAAARAAAVAPDPVTAEILRKHAAGETLTPQESGKLGWWRSQLNRLTGKGGAAPGQAQPGPAPGNAVRLAAVEPAQTPGNSLEPVPVDADLVKRTTAAVLKSADTIAGRYIAREARKAGADDKTAARFVSASALPVASQELIVETSPDLLASLGVDPKSYPLTVCIGCLGMWATNLWLAVDELKQLQEGRKPKDEPKTAPAPVADLSAGISDKAKAA